MAIGDSEGELQAAIGKLIQDGGNQFPFRDESAPEIAIQMLNWPPEQRARLVLAILQRLAAPALQGDTAASRLAAKLMGIIPFGRQDKTGEGYLTSYLDRHMRRKIPFDATQISDLLATYLIVRSRDFFGCSLLRPEDVLDQVIEFSAKSPIKREIEAMILRLKGTTWTSSSINTRINRLIGRGELGREDAWSAKACDFLASLAPPDYTKWTAFLRHCSGNEGSKPTKKWLATSQQHIDAITPDAVRECLMDWFPLAHATDRGENFAQNDGTLRGLVWSCSLIEDPKLAVTIGDLSQRCFKKIPMIGARSAKVGNACLYTLGAVGSTDSVGQLVRLKGKVKYKVATSLLGKAIGSAAESQGMAVEELEEKSVPTFGLDAKARLKRQLGEIEANLWVTESGAAELTFSREGKVLKTIPAREKELFAHDIKDLKKTAKDIASFLSGQKARFERLFLANRTYPLEYWKECYADHPLLSQMTRRLIWEFSEGAKSSTAAFDDGKLVGSDGKAIKWLSAKSQVKLWHPLGAPPEKVLEWRRWLEDRKIVQPFKQAHREIYVLTDAERQTGNYSNRFAAHILRQHQFAALCRERGWAFTLTGDWDSHNTPTLKLPQCGLKVEFWIDMPEYGAGSAQSSVYLYIFSEQVRFYDAQNRQLRLEEVPALSFSEVMRDVDLFVGVCSIGNDPGWPERQNRPEFDNYWHDFSFGWLSESAKTRKEVLASLIPKLKMGPRCSFDDRYLIVRGDLRTYKIHLGSGNIQMEPNNQYLCIVMGAEERTKGKTADWLPFDEDRTLSLILSKAVMLAEDTKIKDSTILSQIRAPQSRGGA